MAKRKSKKVEYNCIFQKEDGGGYSVWVSALPGCTSQGETFEEAQLNIKEAIGLYLKGDMEEVGYSSESHKQFMAPVQVVVHV